MRVDSGLLYDGGASKFYVLATIIWLRHKKDSPPSTCRELSLQRQYVSRLFSTSEWPFCLHNKEMLELSKALRE
jgi:hypothetical protein